MLALCLCSSACVRQPTPRSASIPRAPNLEASAAELAARNHSLLAVFSSELEGAADQIRAQSASPAVRHQALEWKANAIPVLQTALLNPDPVAAAMDAWTYIYQMQAYLKQPQVAAGFDGALPAVAATLARMDQEMERLVLAAAPGANLPDLRRRVGAWADRYPLQGSWSARTSVDAEFVKAAGQGDLGALASLQALQEGLGDITARLDAYNAYLPKQARWQAELLMDDLTLSPQLHAASDSLAAATKALGQSSALMQQLPELAGQTRQAVRADVDAQRLAAQSFLRTERLESLDFMAQQRVAATADLNAERLAATADLRGERRIVLDAIQQDEANALNELRAISQETVRDGDLRARGLIDLFFWRALELLLLTLALVWLGAWLLLRRLLPRRAVRRDGLDRAA